MTAEDLLERLREARDSLDGNEVDDHEVDRLEIYVAIQILDDLIEQVATERAAADRRGV